MKGKGRLYSLFARRRGTRNWRRISNACFTLPVARRLYQAALINMSLSGDYEPRLMPVGGAVATATDNLAAMREGTL